MPAGADLHQFSEGDFIWQRYDPAVKAELFSTALATPVGTYLIDPIPLPEQELSQALAGSSVAGIIVTNANHARAAAAFSRRLMVPLYARVDELAELRDTDVKQITGGTSVYGDLEVIAIDGAAAGEIAIYRADRAGGTVVIGDAIINSGSYGFTLLPAKYCSNPKLLRRSLRQLLERPFERIFFAHGTPILTHGRQRIAELLDALH